MDSTDVLDLFPDVITVAVWVTPRDAVPDCGAFLDLRDVVALNELEGRWNGTLN